MAQYSIETYNLDPATGDYTRTNIADDALNVSYTFVLNAPNYATVEFDVFSRNSRPELWIRNTTHVHIKRNGASTGWFGFLNRVSWNADKDSGRIVFELKGMAGHFEKRYIFDLYQKSNISAGTIAFELINIGQGTFSGREKSNANLGITTNNNSVTTSIDETLEYSPILTALQNQSDNLNGYDFEFVPTFDSNDKVSGVNFNVYDIIYRLRDDIPPITYKSKKLDNGDVLKQTNLKQLDGASYKEIVNYALFLGQGTGQVNTGIDSNAPSQEAYTLREKVVKSQPTRSQNSLATLANRLIKDAAGARMTINPVLDPKVFKPGLLSIGEVINLDLDVKSVVNGVTYNTFINLIGRARIRELTVTSDRDGNESVIPRLELLY